VVQESNIQIAWAVYDVLCWKMILSLEMSVSIIAIAPGNAIVNVHGQFNKEMAACQCPRAIGYISGSRLQLSKITHSLK